MFAFVSPLPLTLSSRLPTATPRTPYRTPALPQPLRRARPCRHSAPARMAVAPSVDELKKLTGYKAVDDYVKSGMVVGLGTGSTAAFAVERLGQKLSSGELSDIVAIPTSIRTKEQAESLGIPLVQLDTHPVFELCFATGDKDATEDSSNNDSPPDTTKSARKTMLRSDSVDNLIQRKESNKDVTTSNSTPILSRAESHVSTSIPGGSLESLSLNSITPTPQQLDCFWQWCLCIALVNFDLELGQALECVYPPVKLSDSERKNIAFSAFPDSNSSEHVGDSTFSFRMRTGPFSASLFRSSLPDISAGDGSPNMPRSRCPSNNQAINEKEQKYMNGIIPIDTDGFLYGYVFFRQQSNSEIRRGFFQKSLVIISPHPWRGLFLYIVRLLGSKFMDCLLQDRKEMARTIADPGSNLFYQPGSSASELLVRAHAEIAAWPSPPSLASPFASYSPISLRLPFFNLKRVFTFPPNAWFPLMYEPLPRSRSASHNRASSNGRATNSSPNTERSPSRIARPLPDILCSPGKLHEMFARSLESMWLCWELMVLGEPILVTADSPRGASETVFGLIELIKPIPFGGDFRPYFTIQDSDFKSLSNRTRPAPASTVLGVTNPVFAKVLEHWPHVIKVVKSAGRPGLLASSDSGNGNQALSSFKQAFGRKSPDSPNAFGLGDSLSRNAAPDSGNGISFSSVIDSVTSKHKSFVSKDKKLIKDIVEASIRGAKPQELNNMIRRHFVELTDRFLQPLNRHFESLVNGNPVNMTLSTLHSKPEIRPFKQETFLKTIESSSVLLPVSMKKSAQEFYRSFLMGANFAGWLQHKTAGVHREWRKRYLSVICETDLNEWLGLHGGTPRCEVECVDILLRIRDELDRYAVYYHLIDGELVYTNATEGRDERSLFVRADTSPSRPIPLATRENIDDPIPPSQAAASLFRASSENSAPSVNGTGAVIGKSHLSLFKNFRLTKQKTPIGKRDTGFQWKGRMGTSVPSVQEYECMLMQFEKLLNYLPADLRTSVLLDTDNIPPEPQTGSNVENTSSIN